MDQAVQQKKRTKAEIAVIAVVIVVAAIVLGIKFNLGARAEKENALMAELSSIRSSVQLYLTLHKNYPPDLKMLATQKYTIGEKQEPYLRGVKIDKENYPVDAFGKRFTYDPKTGWVRAGEERYSTW
jgi:type II secretory pathway pseudopilin PulG